MGLNEASPTTAEIIQIAAHRKLSISMHKMNLPVIHSSRATKVLMIKNCVIYDLLKVKIQENGICK